MEKKENLSQRSKWVAVEPVKPFSVEWAILRFLQGWTAEDLELAIKKNVEVLGWFRLHRPDLYRVLATEEGIKWIKKNLANLPK